MAYIKKDFIERLLERADITEVIGRHCRDLKKRGVNYFCCSPFTQEKTASMAVSPTRQTFKDYSSGKSGNVVTFLMEHLQRSYPEAIAYLAQFYNIAVEYEAAAWAKAEAEKAEHRDTLRPVLQLARELYRTAYQSLPEQHPARREVEQRRQYSVDDITEYQIGYAPGHTYIYNAMQKAGKLAEARTLGLVGERADKYWNRVTYAITDRSGLLIGFAGRDISGGEKAAKWLNPIESVLYQKEKTWYGLDKAARSIHNEGEAWLVEGYNDVIAWQTHGLLNTVAPCGTAITPKQLEVLKKFCSKVVICLDPDKAGLKAMLSHVPVLMKWGFRVEVVLLPDMDPDDFVRHYAKSIDHYSLPALMQEEGVRKDGFRFLLEHYVKGSDLAKADGAKQLIKILAGIEDDSYLEIYMAWLTKESGMPRTKLNGWLKEAKAVAEAVKEEDQRYQLPKEVKVPLSELKKDIERYGMFVAHSRIYMQTGNEKPYTFRECSNFSIEIIQHMQDEKLPMKLVRICNIHHEERIFDIPSEQLNSPQAFDNAMTNHGNFLWTGGRGEFQRLRQYLFDRMGVGQKIEVLGWQPEGFWVWNNGITVPGQGTSPIDENGVWKKGKTSYYIPSANRIYAHNSFKYTPQKKVALLHSQATFTQYAGQMMQVHREHAITGLLFTIATCFLDIVEDKLGNFPLLFLYGPPSTGKDQLIESCQSFFGQPQSPIHIGNKVSTSKAQVRKFAQFRNMVVHLSEYRPGDQQLDELLKGFWDRRGYERGTIDSAYGTETVPVHSSVIYTGNHYPDDDALITRTLAEEMTKSDFSLEEKKQYELLKDMYKTGISHLTAELLQHRPLWEERFKETFRMVQRNLKAELYIASSHDRMISNVAVLGTAYELMKDHVQFPFTWNQYLNHTKQGMERQIRKLNTASIGMKWWDCFLASIRTKTDPIRHGREFKLDDDKLYFNFTHVYNRVAAQWWAQYHEQAPGKSKISDLIKKDSAFIEEKKSVRMDGGRNAHQTSAWVLQANQLSIYEDLYQAVTWSIQEGTATTGDTPY